MADNTVNFPVRTLQRIKNRRGKRSVSCEVTDRWLRFREDSHVSSEGTLVFVDVMAQPDYDKDPRKLCELCINIEELKKVLNLYEQRS